MEIVAMEVSTVLLLAAIVLLLRRQRMTPPQSGSAQVTALEQVAGYAATAQQTCLSALAQLEKNLLALDRRTGSVEQQLARLTALPAAERQEHYQAAALLLAAGHENSRVASVLDLPLLHVEMIRDLKKILDRPANDVGASEPRRPVKATRRKAAGGSVKAKLRPILLTEAVEAAQAVNG